MKARIARFDVFYEVTFSRPGLSRANSFVQVIEPIYDALSQQIHIPSDAIRVENGNTIDAALVAVTLSDPNCVMEARLNGYKIHFFNLDVSAGIGLAKWCTRAFEAAVNTFLHDGQPAIWKVTTPFWVVVDGSVEAMIRQLTWRPNDSDPFGIGATETCSKVRFKSSSQKENWSVGIFLDRSTLGNADLFVDLSTEYRLGSPYETFDDKFDHHVISVKKIFDKIELDIK